MKYRKSMYLIAVLVLVFAAAEITFAQGRNPGQERQRERMQDDRDRMQRGGRRARPGQGRRGRSSSEQNALIVGEMAPDFTLNSVDGKSKTTLSDFREKKPVVLFFGSYT